MVTISVPYLRFFESHLAKDPISDWKYCKEDFQSEKQNFLRVVEESSFMEAIKKSGVQPTHIYCTDSVFEYGIALLISEIIEIGRAHV